MKGSRTGANTTSTGPTNANPVKQEEAGLPATGGVNYNNSIPLQNQGGYSNQQMQQQQGGYTGQPMQQQNGYPQQTHVPQNYPNQTYPEGQQQPQYPQAAYQQNQPMQQQQQTGYPEYSAMGASPPGGDIHHQGSPLPASQMSPPSYPSQQGSPSPQQSYPQQHGSPHLQRQGIPGSPHSGSQQPMNLEPREGAQEMHSPSREAANPSGAPEVAPTGAPEVTPQSNMYAGT